MAIGQLSTGGFARPSVMPNPGLVDPRLLAADYSGLTQGIGNGLQLVGNYNNQRQLALDRADANSLRDLRLAAQRGQLELEPQLQQNALAVSNRNALEAQYRPIELESTSTITPRNRYGAPTQGFTASNDPADIEAGILGTYELTQNKLPGQDVVVQEERVVIDPITKQQRIVRSVKQPLQTAEQIANVEADNAARLRQIEAKAKASEASVKQREDAAREKVRIDEANLKVAQDREARLKNAPAWFVTGTRQFDLRAAQNAADVNKYLLLGGLDDVLRFAGDPAGRGIVLKVQNALTRQEPPGFTPEEAALIDRFRQGGTGIAPAGIALRGELPDIPAAPAPLQPQDQAAAEWAAANPNDPRAASIRQRLGL